MVFNISALRWAWFALDLPRLSGCYGICGWDFWWLATWVDCDCDLPVGYVVYVGWADFLVVC